MAELTKSTAMAMAGLDSLENADPFLLDVREGRPTSPELVEEICEWYWVTGGKFPAVGIFKDVTKKLEQGLHELGKAHESSLRSIS